MIRKNDWLLIAVALIVAAGIGLSYNYFNTSDADEVVVKLDSKIYGTYSRQ